VSYRLIFDLLYFVLDNKRIPINLLDFTKYFLKILTLLFMKNLIFCLISLNYFMYIYFFAQKNHLSTKE